jgi:hypothetical protein
MKPTLKAPKCKLLKVEHAKMLSYYAFKIQLAPPHPGGGGQHRAAAGTGRGRGRRGAGPAPPQRHGLRGGACQLISAFISRRL